MSSHIFESAGGRRMLLSVSQFRNQTKGTFLRMAHDVSGLDRKRTRHRMPLTFWRRNYFFFNFSTLCI